MDDYPINEVTWPEEAKLGAKKLSGFTPIEMQEKAIAALQQAVGDLGQKLTKFLQAEQTSPNASVEQQDKSPISPLRAKLETHNIIIQRMTERLKNLSARVDI